MQLQIKKGVEPVSFQILAAISRLGGQDGWPPFITITAGTDGQHLPHSFHYTGAAVDVRTRDFASKEALGRFLHALAVELGPSFQLLVEADHLHIEMDGLTHPVV